MSYKKLFENNKQTTTVSKYLKKSSPDSLGDGIESGAHLSASIEKQDYFLPPVDYSDPKNFVKFGSAKKYYNNAFEHILNNYPYDGSNLEIKTFYNDLNPLEKYILEEKYPRSTGFVVVGASYGSSTAKSSGYYSSSAEYIQVKGGPHSGTIYSEAQKRTNNLQFGSTQGTTVEFFLKKKAFGSAPFSAASPREVIFDAWNGEISSSAQYGRLTIEMSASTPDRFYVTMQSGTAGFYRTPVPSTGGLTLTGDQWRQFSFAFGSSSAGNTIKFYQSGSCVGPLITTGSAVIGNVTGSLIANLGALRTAPSGATTPIDAAEGYGKLSGSIDEFRFWKTKKNAEDIGRDWFSRVYGGADKHVANVDLGVYFRFNEGITGNTSVDRLVLDYSGRLSNGNYIGYSSANSRNTGSAVDSLSLTSVREIADPIVRGTNSLYTTEKNTLANRGENYDHTNTSFLMNTMPSWIYQEDENSNGELGNIAQIMASYFDTLDNQISEISNLKDIRYLSGSSTGSINEFPFNDRLLDTVGLESPELFENAGILQQFFERDEQINFDQRLVSIKNSIYRNVYNNINHIYKSKGTLPAVRNLVRCFGIDQDVVSLNIYADQSDYPLITNYDESINSKKYVDFSGLTNRQDSYGTVYQYYDSANEASSGLIKGVTGLQQFAFTVENDIVFPDKTNVSNLKTILPSVVSASLFGFHSPKYDSSTSVNLTWAASDDDYGLQVYAVKKLMDYSEIKYPSELIKDVFFLVKDRTGKTLATSSVFRNVYENQRWNLSLCLKPVKYPYSDGVRGTAVTTSGYTLEFYGVNYDTGIKRNSFHVTSAVSYQSGSAMLTGSKRLYMGSHRENFSGTLLSSTDVRSTGLRYWTDALHTGTIDLHGRDADSFGRVRPYQQAYTFQGANVPSLYIPKIETLSLNWDFANLTGSDASGRFLVADFSSGSNNGDYLSTYQGSKFSPINLRQHTGRGDYFEASAKPIQKQYVYSEKTQLPEYVDSDEMTNVMSSDDIIFNTSIRPINYYFSLEKSMYRSISNRMLQLFASIEDMNNLIGEPVSRFRPQYKAMEKLRQIFFNKVGNVPDFEKYVKFYKWIDSAIGDIVVQLFPASAAHSDTLRTMVENHLLERPKIQYHYVGDRKNIRPNDIKGTVTRVAPLCGDGTGWKFNHAPIPLQESSNSFWWKTRAQRNNIEFGTQTAGVLNTRSHVFAAVKSDFTSSAVYCIRPSLGNDYVGGINQYINKIRNATNLTFQGFEVVENSDDAPPSAKKTFTFKATKSGVSSKGILLTPFTPISSSVKTGYRGALEAGGLTGVDLDNLHEDSIHPFRHSIPMQGPFAKTHVGGFQSRHVAPMAQKIANKDDRSEKYIFSLSAGVGTITRPTTEATPKGYYTRGAGSKSPLNISNILTTTGSGITAGVNILGNYSHTYEVVQTSGRKKNNLDFITNNSVYSYSAPTAFLTPPARRAAGLTGSADFPAPRQRSARRTNEAVFVEYFSAPGGKLTSKQQFRDVPSDQYSPNNALPFRNMEVRKPNNINLRTYTGWGGFRNGAVDGILNSQNLQSYNNGVGAYASAYKTQRNTTRRIVLSGTLSSPEIYMTGTIRDNSYIARPIPQADRSQWFMGLSGSNTNLFNTFVVSGSRYPTEILVPTASFPVSDVGSGLYLSTSGFKKYLWGNTAGYAPFSQLRSGQLNRSRFFMNHNIYETVPRVYAASSGDDTSKIVFGGTDVYQDQAGNTISSRYNSKFFEPPVTSRYKPLVHQIQTWPGTPSETKYDKSMEVSLESSYGNQLQGFANRKLNLEAGLKSSYRLGAEKRPYEIIRDNKNNGLEAIVDGIRMVKLFAYEETIYPREVYTYMSGSRARLSFVNNFWKPDTDISNAYAQGIVGAATAFGDLRSPTGIEGANRQLKRLKNSFVTSQGYIIEAVDQTSHAAASIPSGYGTGSIWALDSFLYSDYLNNFIDEDVKASSALLASGELMTPSYGPIFDNGSGALTYLSSSMRAAQYIYGVPSEGTIASVTGVRPDCKVTITDATLSNWNGSTFAIIDNQAAAPQTCVFLFNSAASSNSRLFPGQYEVGVATLSSKADIAAQFSASIALAVQTHSELAVIVPSLGGGDLLGITGSASNSNLNGTSIFYIPKVSAQATVTPWANGVTAIVGGEQAEPRAPGSAYTRPAWTAARDRKVIEGTDRGIGSPPQYPFYKSYESYATDIRLAGQSFTIMPEFRISENIPEYVTNSNNSLIQVAKTLSLTGASQDLFDGQNSNFYGRYATTDLIEYLKTFSSPETSDIEYNKRPRHFGMKSEAIIKLLPYDGFYPSDRSLQIATLFSGAYKDASRFTGTATPNRKQWNNILAPFFAPGILYNSIKSGIGVEYPIWRESRNHNQFMQTSMHQPLAGGLSGALTSDTPAGNIPGKTRRAPFDFGNVEVNKFFWSDTIPFEGLLKPVEYLNNRQLGILTPATNRTLVNSKITASIDQDAQIASGLVGEQQYKLAISNFLASVPQFFLSEKSNGGFLSKFIAQLPAASQPSSPAGTAPTSQETDRTVNVKAGTAYTMEIGLRKTDSFNMYSNPYAFGQPTSTGSVAWAGAVAGLKSAGVRPAGANWPEHRAEFAPFTPPYYYGSSWARLTYMPTADSSVTLSQILNSNTLYIEYGNDNGYLYDFDSGSYILDSTTKKSVTTAATPAYGWNRAWQNRMDIDASVVLNNKYPTSDGVDLTPQDKNKWVIMPKWECPILDFPTGSYGDSAATRYEFSSSVVTSEYTSSTNGMWHQYGIMPDTDQGVYMYIADVDSAAVDFRLSQDAGGDGYVFRTRKLPDYVWAASSSIESLASLVGFPADDVMPASKWVPGKARRLGELGPDNEKTMSEAIIAIPYFYGGKDNSMMQAMTMTADPVALGAKIKQFRKSFTKYSLPPSLEKALAPLLPIDYPEIPDFINPFGGDEYDKIQPGSSLLRVPVVYLLEHSVTLKRQDLADIWQGIMPDIGKNMKVSVTAIDHYMPGVAMSSADEGLPTFPEWMKKEIELGLPRTGHPRVDLIDTAPEFIKNSFQPEIRWLVFRVKERGALGYDSMIYQEINGGKSSLSYNNVTGYIADDLPDSVRADFEQDKARYTQALYMSDQGLDSRITYNWPYDYCSLIELGKISSRVGFRPNLKEELDEFDNNEQ